MTWERGAQPLSGLSGPRGIRGRTPAASTARPLYSGAGEAGMLGGDLPRRNPGPRGRRGGLWKASLLVAGIEAVLRPAQPRKLEIEGGDGFGGSLGEASVRRDRLRRWGGGGAHAGAPVTRTSPAAARSNPAQLGGSLTEQKIRLVVEHVLSLHHIHCLGGAHEQAESTGRAQILAMTRRCPRVATGLA